MGLTKAERIDLATRLEVLVGEVAAASDRRGATEKLDAILGDVPSQETEASGETGPTVEEGERMLAEIERRGQQLEDLKELKRQVHEQLDARTLELAETKQQLAAAQALLEEASQVATPATPASPEDTQ